MNQKITAPSHHKLKPFSLLITAVSVTMYLVAKVVQALVSMIPGQKSARLRGRIDGGWRRLVLALNAPFRHEIPTPTLIFFSEQNLKAGKARTFVTITAISVGIGIIVCLVSLGYGLESLVVSRIAKLEQLRQVDISPKPGSKLKLNDEIWTQLRNNSNVVRVSPAVVLASKVTFQEATSDIPNMGVSKTFLEDAGWVLQAGTLFSDDGKSLGMAQQVTMLDSSEATDGEELTDALVKSDSSKELVGTQSAVLSKEEELLLSLSSGSVTRQNKTKVVLPQSARKQAVVNRSLVRSWGVDDAKVIGQKVEISYVLTGQVLANQMDRVESEPAKYEIIGIIEDKKTPFMYVPLEDMQSLGITHYSQLKAVMRESSLIESFRGDMENQGFATTSVLDTVTRIRSLFSTLKLFLGSIGAVALGVAALGMFNTLTVSLLERTKEIGLVKALGMIAEEVERLFLIEALLISLKGGFYGILLGIFTGKIIGAVLSLTTIPTQFQFIDVSYFPLSLVLGIVVVSFIVGITTGLYPARRSAKISALNALRYE